VSEEQHQSWRTRWVPRQTQFIVGAATFFVALFAVLGALLAPLPLSHAAGAVNSSVGNDPCANVTNTGGGKCTNGPVSLTSQDQLILARKQALADEHARVVAGTFDPAAFQRDWLTFLQQYGGPAAAVYAQAASSAAAGYDAP
jgi:hypothetical protein